MKISALAALWMAACGGGTAHPASASPPADEALCAPIHPGEVLLVGGTWRGRPVRVFVDTAAPTGAVSPAIAAELVPRAGKLGYAGASGEVHVTSAYDVTELEVAGRRLTMGPASVAVTAEAIGFDFHLGVDALAAYVVDVDGQRGRFCLRDREAALDVPMTEMVFGVPGDPSTDIVVTATIGEQRLHHMIVDTGAGISCLNEELVPSVKHVEVEGVESIDASGNRLRQRVIAVDRLCVLEQCAVSHRLMVEPDMSRLVGHPVRGIVGMPFFADRRLLLDFPGRRIGVM